MYKTVKKNKVKYLLNIVLKTYYLVQNLLVSFYYEEPPKLTFAQTPQYFRENLKPSPDSKQTFLLCLYLKIIPIPI